jgi:hypothetical protein
MYLVDATNLTEIKTVLSSGFPLICGMLVDPSVFYTNIVTYTGVITKIPNPRAAGLSGHAVVIVGYTNDGFFLVRNSWGINWGLGFFNQSTGSYNYDEYGGKMRGYFKIPFKYLTTKGIVSELYAIGRINDTTNTIKNTPYTLAPSLDLSFSSEIIIKPIPTVTKEIPLDSVKMKFTMAYSTIISNSKNKYIWTISSLKRASSGLFQTLYEVELNNINYLDDTIKFELVQKSGNIYIYVYHSNMLGSIILVNYISGKLSQVASYLI